MTTGKVTLRGITWDHPRGYDCLRAAAQAMVESTGLRVQWEKRSLKDFGDASLVELARDYDFLIIDHPHAGEVAATAAVLALDELLPAAELAELARHSVGPSFSSYHYNGHQWALPIDAACQVSSYRPDVISAGDIPTSWEEFIDFAAELRRRGKRCAMALCPTDSLCSFLTLVAQSGDAPDESPHWVTQESFEIAVEKLRRVLECCVAESLEWNPIRLYEAMAADHDGTLAYAPLAFGYTNYARAGYRPHRLVFAGIAGGSHALLGGAGIAVSAHCGSAELAATYALRLCQAECQRGIYVQSGGQPAHLAAWQDAGADSLCGGFFSGTLDTIQHAFRRPRFPGWPAFQEKLGDEVHACLRGQTTAAAAWKRLCIFG